MEAASRPLAFRAYFADVRWDGFYRDCEGPWPGRVRWWLMCKRIEACQLFGCDVTASVLSHCVEFRPVE